MTLKGHLHFHHSHSQHPEHSGNAAVRDALVIIHGGLEKLGSLMEIAPVIGGHLKSIFIGAASILANIEVVDSIPLYVQHVSYSSESPHP